jgi:hypothetical protein
VLGEFTTIVAGYRDGYPFGWLDSSQVVGSQVTIKGWAIDAGTAASIDVHLHVDGVGRAVTTANVNRPDIATAYPGYGPQHGYSFTVSDPAGTHTYCTYAINVPAGPNPQLGCVTLTLNTYPVGVLDSVTSGSVRNFVFGTRRDVHGLGCGRKEDHVHDTEDEQGSGGVERCRVGP